MTGNKRNLEQWKKYFQNMAENSNNNETIIREGSSGTSHLTTGPEIANNRMIARLGKDIKGRGMSKNVRAAKKPGRSHTNLTVRKLKAALLRRIKKTTRKTKTKKKRQHKTSRRNSKKSNTKNKQTRGHKRLRIKRKKQNIKDIFG